MESGQFGIFEVYHIKNIFINKCNSISYSVKVDQSADIDTYKLITRFIHWLKQSINYQLLTWLWFEFMIKSNACHIEVNSVFQACGDIWDQNVRMFVSLTWYANATECLVWELSIFPGQQPIECSQVPAISYAMGIWRPAWLTRPANGNPWPDVSIFPHISSSVAMS